MNQEILYVTKEGLDKLKAELKELVEIKRPEVAKRILAARENGDISENAEYDSARQEQSYIEGRISELEEIIKNSKITDSEKKKDNVGVGCIVTVHIDGDEETFHIVGAPEANPLEKKISHESPLGLALMGKKVGDKIDVDAPMGKLTYTVLRID
ncbi:transcription elongation factor GreA [candidate division WWE3 bacterium]|uniref:Transcription elongation factor GreA n=1 Tax=candidate division WWE3 bacterium TaxID=2053526 RepID=A0A7X9DJG1_UNCKA|nr:transcription elongation factor GreA [candidate division WWE3 bacterium]